MRLSSGDSGNPGRMTLLGVAAAAQQQIKLAKEMIHFLENKQPENSEKEFETERPFPMSDCRPGLVQNNRALEVTLLRYVTKKRFQGLVQETTMLWRHATVKEIQGMVDFQSLKLVLSGFGSWLVMCWAP